VRDVSGARRRKWEERCGAGSPKAGAGEAGMIPRGTRGDLGDQQIRSEYTDE
jgi:hypothetical protein